MRENVNRGSDLVVNKHESKLGKNKESIND